MADGVCDPAATRRDLRKGVRKMRQRHGRVFSRFCVGLVLAVALLAVSAGSAGAKNTKPKHNTCTGTTDNFPTELGTLSGTYSGHVDDQREPDHREGLDTDRAIRVLAADGDGQHQGPRRWDSDARMLRLELS